MRSPLWRLSTEKERKVPTNPLIKTKTTIFLGSIFLATVASGCGTLSSYFTYSKCLEKCEQEFKDDSSKQKCKAECLAKFDWSDSLFSGRSLEKPKSDLDKIIEKHPFRKEDGRVGR